jgi:hypothetical protein
MDCDDADAQIFPGADEIPNDGIDQSCSGSDLADENGTGGFGQGGGEGPWTDVDGDGWPAFADCDDDDGTVFPGAEEIPYDGIDQNCSGGDLDDLDLDGYPGEPQGTDCDDTRADVNPGALEIPLDGVDQTCDGSDLVGTDDFFPVAPADAAPATGLALAPGTTDSGDPVALAVWPDSRSAPRQDIYARFVSATGQPLGSEFAIVSGGVAKSNVRVASKGDRYLVAWDEAEGVMAQRVSQSGELEGPVLGIGSPGTTSPQLAWGGANWALVWKSPTEGLQSRGVTPEGVRGDKHVVTGTPGATIGIAGGASGFLVAWDGGGIRGRLLDAVGEPAGSAFDVSSEANVAAPAAAFDGQRYLVAFRRGAGAFSARAKFVSSAGSVSAPGESLRLSGDALLVTDLRVVPTSFGFFSAWNDGRHLGVAPPHGSIYGNLVAGEHGEVLWPGAAALHVDVTAALGDTAFVGESLLVASKVGSVHGVVRWRRMGR